VPDTGGLTPNKPGDYIIPQDDRRDAILHRRGSEARKSYLFPSPLLSQI